MNIACSTQPACSTERARCRMTCVVVVGLVQLHTVVVKLRGERGCAQTDMQSAYMPCNTCACRMHVLLSHRTQDMHAVAACSVWWEV